nr:LysE family transporter [uncultured Ottowia sp.]
MFGITDIVTYTIAAAMLVALPGPNSMLCMHIAAQHGVKVARRAMAGTFLGNGTLIVASALGAGSVLKTWPFLYDALRIVGASYLAWLGARMLWGPGASGAGRRRSRRRCRFSRRAYSERR